MKRLLSCFMCLGIVGLCFYGIPVMADGLWYETAPSEALEGINESLYEYITNITQYDTMGNMVLQLMAGQQSQILHFEDGRVVSGELFTNDDGWQSGAIKYEYHGVNLIAVEYKQKDGVAITVFADPSNHTDGLMPTLTLWVKDTDDFIGKDTLADIMDNLGRFGSTSKEYIDVGQYKVGLVSVEFSYAWYAHHADNLESAMKAELEAFGSPGFGQLGGLNIFDEIKDLMERENGPSLQLSQGAITLSLWKGNITSFTAGGVSVDLEVDDPEQINFADTLENSANYDTIADLNGDGSVSDEEKNKFRESVLYELYSEIMESGITDVIGEEFEYTLTYEEDGETLEAVITVNIVAEEDGDGVYIDMALGDADSVHIKYFTPDQVAEIDEAAGGIDWGSGDDTPEDDTGGPDDPSDAAAVGDDHPLDDV